MTTVKLNFELEDKEHNVKIADVEEAAKRFSCVKYSDPKWQRRYTKALKRSHRNVAYLKRTGRCR